MKRCEFLIAGTAAVLATPSAGQEAPLIKVYKTQTCGCCSAWVDHLISAGIRADTLDVGQEQLWTLKEQMKIADELSSCHTAIVGDYFVEGHVLAEDIYRLLAEHPEGLGLTVPGMPMGSPGMDFSDEREPYETLLVGLDGKTSVFTRHS
ncbi:DUF411 domain-containing protein [Ruegeria conchae]|uniref:DUF411 domain-containing protein n=1 Tax=Ruegeria conchae TaxID=981384 RepID=UPI0029C6646A|nr:DUF411 domain-containing protein [Ruegeria conchae]